MDSNLIDSRTSASAPFKAIAPALQKLFFPPEIQKTLDTTFMGMKLWMVILLAILLPIPKFVIPILIVMMFPGLKDKLSNIVRNGNPSEPRKP